MKRTLDVLDKIGRRELSKLGFWEKVSRMEALRERTLFMKAARESARATDRLAGHVNQPDLQTVDWSRIPVPIDDGGARHLVGQRVPSRALPSTQGRTVDLASQAGHIVVYAYPMTGRPGIALPDDWDMIPGARGCTPQACAFADHFRELAALGVAAVFGLSSQDPAYQKEAAERLHLPFELLSDARLDLATALGLPTIIVSGSTLLKRLTMVVEDGRIGEVFYPVFPPDRAARDVVDWLRREVEARASR